MDDFTDFALIGHILSVSLLTALLSKGILARDHVSELLEEALLTIERYQSSFPENEAAFESARAFLEKSFSDLPSTTPLPPLA